jgi:ribonucleoside-diphosphate reductase alpha chain
MKLLEDSFSYANQLGARQGAGAVYLHAHHPDILRFLDTKRERRREDPHQDAVARRRDPRHHVRAGQERRGHVPVLAVRRREGLRRAVRRHLVTEKYREMVDDARIKKTKINAREFFQTLAEIQFESGYPYIMFEDTVNKANPIKGRINMSNLCSEILQVNTPTTYNEDLSYAEIGKDISCNLGSMNIALAMDGKDLAADGRDLDPRAHRGQRPEPHRSVRSIEDGNDRSHAIGLGQMNLHGYLAREHVTTAPKRASTSRTSTSTRCSSTRCAPRTDRDRARHAFDGFADSTYASGEFFDKYTEQEWEPQTEKVRAVRRHPHPDAGRLARAEGVVQAHGIYNQNLQAVPPTGSISYINNSTSSIHPIASKIEIRKEGKIGRVYYPAPFMTNDNLEYYQDAYEIGYEKVIDTYAAATQHVDQGLSLTLFFKDTATTRDINKAQIYAWRKGIKTIYYIRLRQMALEGTS